MNSLILAADFKGTNETAIKILNGVRNGYQNFEGSIDRLWDKTFNGGVYSSLTTVAISFAVLGLLFFTLRLTRQWLKDEFSYESIQDLIVTLLIIILLANNGQQLKDTVYGLRGIVNNLNDQFLSNLHEQVVLQDALEKVVNSVAIKGEIQSQYKNCDLQTDPVKRSKCFNKVMEEIAKLPGNVKTDNQFAQALESLKNNTLAALNFDILPSFPSFQPFLIAGLTSLGVGIQVLAEICMLLTGLIAPIPVALTLLPGKTQTIFTWIIAFFSIGFFRLFYNTMVGLTAVLVLESNWIGDLTFAFIVGLISPILAATLSIGGGMAILNSMFSATNGAINGLTALSLGRRVINKPSFNN